LVSNKIDNNVLTKLSSLHKPEALTAFSRSLVQKYNPHDNNYLQPAGGGQLIPPEIGQVPRLMHLEIRPS